MPGAVGNVEPGIGEVVAETVRPLGGEQRIMLRPQHIGGHVNLDGAVGRQLDE